MMQLTLSLYLLCALIFFFPDKKVSQELMVLIAEEGQSVNLNCKFMHVIEGLYLKRTFGDVRNVLYVTQHGKIKKEDSAYENRTGYFEMNNTVTITLKHLKENDSDVYMCMAGMVINNDLVQKNSSPILLAIKSRYREKDHVDDSLIITYKPLTIFSPFLKDIKMDCTKNENQIMCTEQTYTK
uniref:Ig-like domain-containing protein n=1 Tax=Laticauda laticaudata TaxID=8630 RepID=A0A8C5RZ38_LATLA